MSVGKDRLIFDTSSPENSDNVGAFIRTTSGIVSSQTIGSTQSLNIHSTSSKEEDTPHISGSFGDFLLGVRHDAGTPLADDGDYIPLTTDAFGALRVSASGVKTETTPFSSFVGGVKTVLFSGVSIALSGTTAISSVVIQALSTNTQKVFVGPSGMTVHELFPTDALVVNINDLSKVFITSDVSGEGVNFLALA